MTERVYTCRWCGRAYRSRRSLTRRGYCPGECGAQAMIAWLAAQKELARSLRVSPGGGTN